MRNVANTIEDLLEILSELQGQSKIQMESSDITIMHSLARQVFKGTALTDRQYTVTKEKLLKYRTQFASLDCNFDLAVETLRMPLRKVDRSKYITIVDTTDVYDNIPYESFKEKWKWIKIRFLFNKKLILLLDNIPKKDYFHKKGVHEHYYKLTENSVYSIIETFKNKNFEIDSDLITLYEKVKDIAENKSDYIPGVYEFKLKNLKENTEDHLIKLLGVPSKENLYLYKDRRKVYGLDYFDDNDVKNSLINKSLLTSKITNRTKANVYISSQNYTYDQVMLSLYELDRFPLIIVVDEKNALTEINLFYKSSKDVISSSDQSVLFRLDNDNNKDFNDYVRDKKLNNPLDKNTKIVYISNSKFQKTILKSDLRYRAVLLSKIIQPNTKLKQFINDKDLIIWYDSNMSQMMRYHRSGIEEL